MDEPAFRDGTLVWGRVVDDIPAFCRELVAALAAGREDWLRFKSAADAVLGS